MALFIGDYTKSPTTKISISIEQNAASANMADIGLTISSDNADYDVSIATVDSNIVKDDIDASIRKTTGKCTKTSWATLWYFEKGHQVVIKPSPEKPQYDVPLNITSIANDTLAKDDPTFHYIKDAIIIVTDVADPVRFTIDPRNTVGTVTATITDSFGDPLYKMYVILVKYNNWSKLNHPAHLAIHDKSGSRAVRSYILGSATVELGNHNYTMNALLEDQSPEEELRLLTETIQKEKERAAARRNKFAGEKDHPAKTSSNNDYHGKRNQKNYRDYTGNKKKPQRPRQKH